MLRKFSRILVVDDSATMRRVVSGMLREMGHENVDQACDGRSALAMLMARNYALVITDWNMEPMNGAELLKALRQACPFATMPFIMMTAHAVKFAAVARQEGVIHYLIKPFKLEQLSAKILIATAGIAA